MTKYNFCRTCLSVLLLFSVTSLFSQQKISGKTVNENGTALGSVFILNISKENRTQSDSFGNFIIEAEENDEIRFMIEDYYRTDRIIKKENINAEITVMLLRLETLIPEVKVEYKPTGNLKNDISRFNDSRKVAKLKSSMEDYMKSPMDTPVPVNSIPKPLRPHDFQAGQINMVSALGAAIALIQKASKPKITKPDYYETQDFLIRIKNEVNLSFLEKYGMDEEGIDRFLLYAEKVNTLSKKYRKDFKPHIVMAELKIAFAEYAKLNKLSSY